MPVLLIAILVLVAWGVGAAVGSAASFLAGAVVGAAVAITLLALFGFVAAWRSPSR